MGLLTDAILLDVVAFFITAILFAYYRFTVSTAYWAQKGVHQLKPTFPFGNFTNTFFQRQSIGEEFANFYHQLKGQPFGGVYRFSEPVLVLKDPEVIKFVLTKNFQHFQSRGVRFDEKTDPLAANLSSLEGDKWKNLRTKLTPTFTSGKIKLMFPILEGCAKELKETVSNFAINGEELEIREILARYGTDIIASVVFGIQANCLKNPDSEFRRWGKKMFAPGISRAVIRLIKNISIVKRFVTFPVVATDITQYFTTLVANTIEYREKNNIVRNDFMQLLIQLKNQGYVEEDFGLDDFHAEKGQTDVRKLTISEIAAQAFVFFFAGFETSSSTLGYCIHELCLNQDIQTKLQREIDDTLKKSGGKITYDEVMGMKYLDMVISETLRKYPSVPVLQRTCTKDCQMPNTDIVIKKDTLVAVPVYGIHYDERYYENACDFNPQRFTKEEKAKRHPYVYLPFGEGPRICIGMRFGQLQIKLALISLLSKYRLITSERTVDPVVHNPRSFTLAPNGGIWVKITNRTST